MHQPHPDGQGAHLSAAFLIGIGVELAAGLVRRMSEGSSRCRLSSMEPASASSAPRAGCTMSQLLARSASLNSATNLGSSSGTYCLQAAGRQARAGRGARVYMCIGLHDSIGRGTRACAKQ